MNGVSQSVNQSINQSTLTLYITGNVPTTGLL